MASNLRVDNIQPSTGMGIGIGTANGSVTIAGDLSVDTSKGLTVGTGATIYGSTNTITAFTNGSERVRINSSGRIGINNTSGPTDIPGTAHETVVVGNPTATAGGITLEVASGNNCGFQMYAQGSQPAARFLYIGSSNTAEIWSQNSGGTSESVRMIFQEDGDVSIANGNLVLASGHGIDFSATANGSGTTTSELLDDYEEGTWTPKVSFGGSDAGVTYSSNEGAYTKVGRLVTCYGNINLSSNGTATGAAAIFNLPFATANNLLSGTALEGGGHNTYQSACTGTIYGPMGLAVVNNNTFAYYYGATTTGGNMGNMDETNLSNNYDCRFILWYYTE